MKGTKLDITREAINRALQCVDADGGVLFVAKNGGIGCFVAGQSGYMKEHVVEMLRKVVKRAQATLKAYETGVIKSGSPTKEGDGIPAYLVDDNGSYTPLDDEGNPMPKTWENKEEDDENFFPN